MALIHLRDIHLAFGIAPILDGIDFNIEQGERVCLIGRNGEGKSTLFKVISGQVKADSGEFQISGNLKIAMLEQDIPETSGKVSDIVMAGAGDVATWLTAYEQASDKCASGDMKACELMSDLQHKIDDAHGWNLTREVQTMLSMMNLDGDADISELSGGRKRRVLLAARPGSVGWKLAPAPAPRDRAAGGRSAGPHPHTRQ